SKLIKYLFAEKPRVVSRLERLAGHSVVIAKKHCAVLRLERLADTG
ncbi:15270_t:CDS:2, partial [Entrophospora sp. SA101]